jgi:exodeoxyribonuclease VII small subunit
MTDDPADKSSASAASPLGFEQALQRLEQIAVELEEGQLGLTEALVRYDEGVQRLRQCYDFLSQAERKIELLSGIDAEGNPITAPFDDSVLSTDDASEHRGKRRSSGKSPKSKRPASDDDVDAPDSLF